MVEKNKANGRDGYRRFVEDSQSRHIL